MLNPKDIIQSSSPTSNIAVNSTPIASVPRPQPQATSFTATPSSAPIVEAVTRRPIAITIFLWLIFLDLTYRIVNSIIAIVTLISGFRANHLLAHIFETSPLLCFSPFFFAVLAVAVLFLIFKTTAYSKNDHRLLLIFLVILPVSFSIYTRLISISVNLHPLLAILNETNLLFLIILILLFVTSKSFAPYSNSLSDNSTIALALIGSVLLFPSFFFTYYLINTSLNPDTKMNSIQSLAGYKIYSPAILPLKLRPDTTFYIDDKKPANLPNSMVKIVYSTPIVDLLAKRPSVIINQTKVTPEFDLDSYMNGQLTSMTSKPQSLNLSIALNQKALIKSSDPNSSSTLAVTSLAFITSDYVLVNIISPSPEITQAHLVTIAESLR